MADYRAGAPRCPACGEGLDSLQVGDALVDVCRACKGLFLDWADGPPRSLAEALVPPADTTQVGAPPAGLAGSCPRCAVPFHVELFEDRGPYVHRCEGCAGLFVDLPSARLLTNTAPPDAPPPAPGPLARLLAVVRALLAP